jgi:hypothetical protein
MANSQAKMMSLSGSEVFSLQIAVHRNGAMTKANVNSIVWLVGAADWMIGAAAGDGVGVFAVPTHVTAPVFLLVILHPVVAIAGTTVALAVVVVALVVLAVGGVAVIALAAIVDAVAVMLMLRLTKSSMVLQLVISIEEGMEVVVDATTVTACALGPVPIKQTIEVFGCDCVLPNLAQL